MATEEEKTVGDPLTLAMDLLIETLATLGESSVDPEKRGAARNVILLVQAMAQLEIARNLRKTNELLEYLGEETNRLRMDVR